MHARAASLSLTLLGLLLSASTSLLQAQGVVLAGAAVSGDTVTFRYRATNPDEAAFGWSARLTLDVAAPRAVGTQWIGVRDRLFVDDLLEVMPNAALGHAPLSLTCPTAEVAGAWISGVSEQGEAWCELYAAGTGTPAGLRRGQAVSLTVRAIGIPFLRIARMVPWAPLPVDPGEGNGDRGPQPAGVPVGREARTVVPGPGVPAAALRAIAVKAQVALACQSRLLSAPACAALPGLIDAGNRTGAIAALGATPAPMLALTLVLQLRAYR